MAGKNFIQAIFIVVFTVALSSCVKYPPYEFPEDTVETRKNKVALALTEKLSPDSIEHTVRWLQSMGTRFALADNHRDVAVRIRDKFRKMGYPDARLDSFNITRTWKSVVYSMKQYNVIAELRGSRYPDSIMIIGAHYDSMLGPEDPFIRAPGADDNASGTAALLEIARVMKTNNYKPLSGIHFVAFGAEELGLLGSYDYASRIGPSGRYVKLMINNDMIGYVSESNPSWKVNIITYSNAIELLEKSKSMCRFYTKLNYINDNANYNRSDSYPFYVNNYKTVFFMSASLNPYYHSITDTFDKCNFDFCAEVASLSCALLVWSDTHEL